MCFVIDVKEHSHDITAFCVTNCSYTACVLNFSYIPWMLKMIHNFFAVHNIYSSCFRLLSDYCLIITADVFS